MQDIVSASITAAPTLGILGLSSGAQLRSPGDGDTNQDNYRHIFIRLGTFCICLKHYVVIQVCEAFLFQELLLTTEKVGTAN